MRERTYEKRININKFIRCEWCGDRIDWRSNVLLLLPVVRYISQLKMFLLMWCAREWSTHTQLTGHREMIPDEWTKQRQTDQNLQIRCKKYCVFRCVCCCHCCCRCRFGSVFIHTLFVSLPLSLSGSDSVCLFLSSVMLIFICGSTSSA